MYVDLMIVHSLRETNHFNYHPAGSVYRPLGVEGANLPLYKVAV